MGIDVCNSGKSNEHQQQDDHGLYLALGIKNTRTGAAVTRIISAVYGRWRMDIKNALVKVFLMVL